MESLFTSTTPVSDENVMHVAKEEMMTASPSPISYDDDVKSALFNSSSSSIESLPFKPMSSFQIPLPISPVTPAVNSFGSLLTPVTTPNGGVAPNPTVNLLWQQLVYNNLLIMAAAQQQRMSLPLMIPSSMMTPSPKSTSSSPPYSFSSAETLAMSDRKDEVPPTTVPMTATPRARRGSPGTSSAANREVRCNICSKTFTRPWLLQNHIRVHTGEKPYQCPTCDKCFADKSNLRAHIQTHSGVKPYGCNRCGKTFALKAYLSKHEESACLRGRNKRDTESAHSFH